MRDDQGFIKKVLAFRGEGKNLSQIARLTGKDRKTIRRLLRRVEAGEAASRGELQTAAKAVADPGSHVSNEVSSSASAIEPQAEVADEPPQSLGCDFRRGFEVIERGGTVKTLILEGFTPDDARAIWDEFRRIEGIDEVLRAFSLAATAGVDVRTLPGVLRTLQDLGEERYGSLEAALTGLREFLEAVDFGRETVTNLERQCAALAEEARAMGESNDRLARAVFDKNRELIQTSARLEELRAQEREIREAIELAGALVARCRQAEAHVSELEKRRQELEGTVANLQAVIPDLEQRLALALAIRRTFGLPDPISEKPNGSGQAMPTQFVVTPS